MSQESKESIKRLITRACDACRKKKIRCEPVSDVCAQCIKSNTPCHFTPISVIVGRRRLAKEKRVEELEKRLEWVQDQLSLPADRRQSLGDLQTGTNGNKQDKSLLGSGSPEIEEYVRDSQTPRIPTPSQQMIVSGASSLVLLSNSNSFGSAIPLFQELPSKEKALQLITIYFQGINKVHPIFNLDTFMPKFDSAYGLDCPGNDPGWWAALNIVFALAYQSWDMSISDTKEDDEAWGYFQNALGATNHLITRNYTLESVQAMLGLALIMLAMLDYRPSVLLTSSAIKIAHNLGLHRQYHYPTLSAVESAERLRVFWVAYSLDKDISLRTSEPPTQSDDEMDIEPPSENEYGPIQPGRIHHNIFYFQTRLAMIQSQIYRRLLSVKAGKQSTSDRAMAAAELEMTLQRWRRSVPIELFNDYSDPLDGPPSDTSRYPVCLHLIYFRTLAVIQDFLLVYPLQPEIWSSQIKTHIMTSIMSVPLTYPVEARSAIKLFNVTPRRKFACVW